MGASALPKPNGTCRPPIRPTANLVQFAADDRQKTSMKLKITVHANGALFKA
jgi:hypothetical protein